MVGFDCCWNCLWIVFVFLVFFFIFVIGCFGLVWGCFGWWCSCCILFC